MTHVLSPGEIPDIAPAPVENEEWRENLNVRMICPDCKEDPPNLYDDHQSGDTLCDSCGLVLAARGIDTRAEWRTFANDDQGNDDPSRVGDAPNPLLNGNQLETSIAFGDGSMRSKELHRAQNKTSSDKTNKGLLQAFKQIGAYCDSVSLPAIVSDGAKHIFKDAEESKLFKGKSQEALIAGCIFISCRRNSLPRTFREIYNLTKVSKKEIGKVFKMLEKFLQEKTRRQQTVTIANGMRDCMSYIVYSTNFRAGVVGLNEEYKATQTTDPSQLCDRYCGRLELDFKATNLAKDIAAQMSVIGALAGRSPVSAAAVSIYMASYLLDTPKSPADISKHITVSDSTIKNAYKSLYKLREQLVTAEWLAKGAKLERLPVP